MSAKHTPGPWLAQGREAIFAAIDQELLTVGVAKGHVKHDKEWTGVMTELTQEYWPGCRMIEGEF